MSGREAAKRAFLAAAGWRGARLSPLAGDASNRRYERAAGGPGGAAAVLMDAPAERGEDIGAFLAHTGWLRGLGFSAPDVYAADPALGFALIEDLGDGLFARVCGATPERERECYAAAVDLLVALRRAPPPGRVAGFGVSAGVRPYDAATLEREALLFADWWVAAATGAPPSADFRAEFQALVRGACAQVSDDRRVMALRDYHAENLIWLPDRRGDARVGLLDYQDALRGAPAYDIVSLLEDARRDVAPAVSAAMRRRYLAATGDEADRFTADFASLGAQRNLKIVGIFARLRVRDGKPAYLGLIPRVWAHLMRDLSHPDLAELAGFVADHVPAPDSAALARVGAAA